jgi:hypothetical protein
MKTHAIGYLLCGAVLAALMAIIVLACPVDGGVSPALAATCVGLVGGALGLAAAAWGTAFRR